MNFESYLITKKIDSAAFLMAEPDVWKTWCYEFEQVHPNSFTLQKLYLINPIRRKYPLKAEPVITEAKSELPGSEKSQETASNPETPAKTPLNPKPAVQKPVFKPKPKMN